MTGLTSKKISYHPDIAFRIIDGEAIVITPKNGVMHSLNGIGTGIWSLLERAPTLEQVVKWVVDGYDVAPEKAQEDVVGFLETLREKGLVRIE